MAVERTPASKMSLHRQQNLFTTSTLFASFATVALAGNDARASPGCANIDATPIEHKRFGWQHIDIADYVPIKRKFWLTTPPVGIEKKMSPLPLIVSMHGQYGTAKDQANVHKGFATAQRKHGFIGVFPQGIDDHLKRDEGTGWNCGSGGVDDTCVSTDSSHACYESCKALGKCGKCNWSTCYDDVKFIKAVLDQVANENCVDLNRVYLHGESNGGMLSHHLVYHLPDTFAAVSPWFGLPLLGFRPSANPRMRQTAILQLHDRSDTLIPFNGSVGEGGWLFEKIDTVQAVWAKAHGCAKVVTPLHTQWTGTKKNFRCFEYEGCTSKRRVIRCWYNGVHGDWPVREDGDEIALWFFQQFARDTEPDLDLNSSLVVV